MEFSHEELLETVERLVAGLLDRAGVTAPPVDARHLAEHHLGIPIAWVDDAETDDDRGRRRPRASRGRGIVLTPNMSEEQQQRAAATSIAHHLLPNLYHKLGLDDGRATKTLAAHLRTLTATRILIPTRLLRSALRECKWDIAALHHRFHTASMEAVALRLLDLEEHCVIAMVDDGVVASRRSNFFPATRKLEAAELECVERITTLDQPHHSRRDSWRAWGWPVPNRPFRRILLRAVRDDV
ncbi:MAG: hypothetical protein RMJ56_14555 [Gemmataceae bacterium]|nr:hypothetical protein [Gemmata sp.]MDW8198815.1 hypothetical protein [Gemmataceae bacterium]